MPLKSPSLLFGPLDLLVWILRQILGVLVKMFNYVDVVLMSPVQYSLWLPYFVVKVTVVNLPYKLKESNGPNPIMPPHPLQVAIPVWYENQTMHRVKKSVWHAIVRKYGVTLNFDGATFHQDDKIIPGDTLCTHMLQSLKGAFQAMQWGMLGMHIVPSVALELTPSVALELKPSIALELKPFVELVDDSSDAGNVGAESNDESLDNFLLIAKSN